MFVCLSEQEGWMEKDTAHSPVLKRERVCVGVRVRVSCDVGGVCGCQAMKQPWAERLKESDNIATLQPNKRLDAGEDGRGEHCSGC